MTCQPISARASRCLHAVLPTRAARSKASARASIAATAMHATVAAVAAAHPVITAAATARASGGHPAGSVVYATTAVMMYAPAATRARRRHCCCCVSFLLQRRMPFRVRALRRAARLSRLQLPIHLSDAALSAAHHASWEQVLQSSCVAPADVVALEVVTESAATGGALKIISHGVGE